MSEPDDRFDRLEATYFDDNGIRLLPKTGHATCPRCFRKMNSSRFLRRPHWRLEGDAICGACIKEEQDRIISEEALKDLGEYLRKIEGRRRG